MIPVLLQDLLNAMFPDSSPQWTELLFTWNLLHWVLARCISFCLDRIWGRVKPEQVTDGLNFNDFTSDITLQYNVCKPRAL